MFKFTARIFFIMVHAGNTVLIPSYMCLSKVGSVMYQLYKHLYTKIGDMILLISHEQPSLKKRTYKKSAHIGNTYTNFVCHTISCAMNVHQVETLGSNQQDPGPP